MSTPHDESGLNTPPFGGPHNRSEVHGAYPGPQYLPDGRLAGYSAADFPAPAGVPELQPGSLAPGWTGPTQTQTRAPSSTAPRSRKRFGSLVAAATVAALIGAGAGIGSYAYVSGDSVTSAGSPVRVTTVSAANSPVLDGTVEAAAAAIEPSVVTITVQSGQSGDIGTGVVLDTEGHILTNNHVVEAAAQQGTVTVAFQNGDTAKATIVGTSASNDLAVIKVDGVSDLKPATFAASGTIKVGQAVVATGAPLGLSETVTSGIVSNTARPVRSGADNDAVYLAVQTDTAINPGNSGGPLVNLNGDVVGINSSIASTSSGSSGSQAGSIGIGFAIPSDVASRVAAELIASGKSVNAAMGVTVGGSDSASAAATATGVTLQTVVAAGGADKAGLQAGDEVTRVNDFSTTTADGLIAATRFYAPGTKVTVTYVRDSATQKAEVTLGSS